MKVLFGMTVIDCTIGPRGIDCHADERVRRKAFCTFIDLDRAVPEDLDYGHSLPRLAGAADPGDPLSGSCFA